MDQTASILSLADWRRRVAELYARVRAGADPALAWQAWRAGRDDLLASHPQSPLSGAQAAHFDSLPFFDYDPAFRVLVELDAPDAQHPESLDLGADGVITLEPAARTRGLAARFGGELTLYWIAGYGGGLFLPFTDATSGRETYGGGRYLLDAIKGADLGTVGGRLVLDFNFAYNPSCAYASLWTCPLAPRENHLPAAVKAGEQAVALEEVLRRRA